MSIKTIGEALDAYAKRGPRSIYPGYRSLLSLILELDVDNCIQNHSYLDALLLTEEMLDNTRHSFRMLTGVGADLFIDALHTPFIRALDRIQGTDGTAQVILVNAEKPDSLKQLEEQYPDTFEVRLGAAKAPNELNHLIICDDGMVRIEEPHAPLTRDSSVNDVRADVYFDNSLMAEGKIAYFDAAWEHLGKSVA